MRGVTYDTGALIAAERNDRRMWALHAGFLALEITPTVPATVLVEAWRGGGRQASMARLLALCRADDLDEHGARDAGVLIGEAGGGGVVDATVVGGAIDRGDVVVTSDPDDIAALADAVGETLILERV